MHPLLFRLRALCSVPLARAVLAVTGVVAVLSTLLIAVRLRPVSGPAAGAPSGAAAAPTTVTSDAAAAPGSSGPPAVAPSCAGLLAALTARLTGSTVPLPDPPGPGDLDGLVAELEQLTSGSPPLPPAERAAIEREVAARCASPP